MKLSKNTENISITLPSWLIELMEEVCDMKDFNRSSFCKRAIKRYILYQTDCPRLWQELYKEMTGK